MLRYSEKVRVAFAFSLWLFCLFIIGCGGNEEEVGAHEAIVVDSTSGYSLKLSLFEETTNLPSTSISETSPGELVIQVLFAEEPVINAILAVNITSGASEIARVNSGNNSVLTDANGLARVLITAGGTDGAGTINVSLTPHNSNNALSANLNFSSTGGGASSADTNSSGYDMILSLTSESGVSNTIRGDDPGTLTARILDLSGNPVDNQLIVFSSEIVTFDPTAGTALTNSEGYATINVIAGSTTGIATIIAAISDGTVSEDEEEDSTEAEERLFIQVNPPSIQFGSTANNQFTSESLNSTITSLSAGGVTSISANIIDENGDPFTLPLPVTFTSNCVSENLSSIDESVLTFNGEVTVTYQANGCVGTDIITATIDFGGTQFTATTEITVANDEAGAISFTSAEPTTIVLQGSGGQSLSETSLVTFRVLGTQGLPLPNQTVNFSLTTEVGGLSLTNASSLSDSDGFVSTTVRAGTIATSVVVIASLDSEDISTQSGILVVSSGVPDQDSFTVVMDPLNPEALRTAGDTTSVTAYAADIFNNPVPDGVSIKFTVESGRVSPSCVTEEGSCQVTWTSQNPQPSNGIATLLVTAVGAESFGDVNGNGIFDDGDLLTSFDDVNNNNIFDTGDIPNSFVDINGNNVFDDGDIVTAYTDTNTNGIFDDGDILISYTDVNNNGIFEQTDFPTSYVDANRNGVFDDGDYPTPYDLDEAFRDDNENQVWDQGELYVDFNANGSYDTADSLYNGPRCEDDPAILPNDICPSGANVGISVRDSIQFVISGSEPFLTFNPPNNPSAPSAYASFETISVSIFDENGNSMPGDTEISIESSVGSLLSPSEITIPRNTLVPYDFSIVIDLTDVDPPTGTGIITITSTTPKEIVYSTLYYFDY